MPTDSVQDLIPKEFPSRPCPACGGWDREVLFIKRFDPIQGLSVFKEYQVVVCAYCNLGFADRIPGQAAFDLLPRMREIRPTRWNRSATNR